MIDYNLYIHSKEWEEKKRKAYQFHGLKCKKCGQIKFSHVHHITYERLGEEKLTDLIILCEKCHSNFHKLYGTKTNMEFETAKFLQKEVVAKKQRKHKRKIGYFPTNAKLISISKRNTEKIEKLKELKENSSKKIKVIRVLSKEC